MEKEIETVVSNVFKLEDDEVAELSFIAVPISKKFYSDEYLLKTKVSDIFLIIIHILENYLRIGKTIIFLILPF